MKGLNNISKHLQLQSTLPAMVSHTFVCLQGHHTVTEEINPTGILVHTHE